MTRRTARCCRSFDPQRHRFSETLPNFVNVGALPEHQELGPHMLDSIDYAANAGVVPAIACMGEKDVFFQAQPM